MSSPEQFPEQPAKKPEGETWRLRSLIALGLLVVFVSVFASLGTAASPLLSLLHICFLVLAFPLVLLVLLLVPQVGPGIVMFIVAAVANCYLWGYCIERIVKRLRRS